MKRFLLTLGIVLCAASLFAQDVSRIAIEFRGTFENNRINQNAVNNDYCPYYVVASLKEATGSSSMPGNTYSTTIYGLSSKRMYSLNSSGENSVRMGISCSYYRGDINKEPNIDFRYALPVKQGTTAKVCQQNNRDHSIVFDLEVSIDTVYACRGGIVCNDDFYDSSAREFRGTATWITIYHDDGTMAEYKMLSKPLVHAGDVVKMGEPIAVCESGDSRVVSVGVYYLDKNKVHDESEIRKHSHLNPLYHVLDSGVLKLERDNSYTAEITEEMLLQDMNRSQQKRYLKKRARDNK